MRQSVFLAVDRDLPRLHPDLLHEGPYDLLPFGLVATDKTVTDNIAEFPHSRGSYSGRPTLDLLAQRLCSLI
ncbi:hypothetical protein [Qipengyuania sp.]|uniref:hypothetical protein n=1 Tax=Qipengyuania sp. TaxID=2004515 RepID=UPI003736C730